MEVSKELQQAKPKGTTTIQTDSGEITLSPEIVKRYLVNGNGNVSDQEIMMFMALCKARRLNPFIRQAYLIKYGNEHPATIVTGKEVFTERAMKNPDCNGFTAGIVTWNPDDKVPVYGKGIVPPGNKLIGGWARVDKKGWACPIEIEVDFNEYVGKTKTGQTTRMWAEKPATMIRKVALVQALREAFPSEYQGMYSPEEINSVDRALPDEPVNIIDSPPVEPQPDKRRTRKATKEPEMPDFDKPIDFVSGEPSPDPPPPETGSPYKCRYEGQEFDPAICSSCAVQGACDAIQNYRRDMAEGD